MVMALAFHTEDPDGVGEPDLSPLAGSEAAFLTRNWDEIFGSAKLTYFVDTSLLMGKQKVSPTADWDEFTS